MCCSTDMTITNLSMVTPCYGVFSGCARWRSELGEDTLCWYLASAGIPVMITKILVTPLAFCLRCKLKTISYKLRVECKAKALLHVISLVDWPGHDKTPIPLVVPLKLHWHVAWGPVQQ